MRSLLLVAMNNLRRRKGQGLLVGTIIGLSILLFFTGIGVMREIDGPFTAMFDQQRGSHLTVVFDSNVDDIEAATAWWEARPETAGVTPAMPVVPLFESSFFEGKELSSFLFVTERLPGMGGQDTLRFVAGAPMPHPGHGEVWVSTSLAQEAGITPGGSLEIPGAEGLRSLRVTAVVVDPQFSAPFNNPTRVWVGPGELPYYFQSPRLSQAMVGVRLADPAASDSLWSEFVTGFGGAFSGTVYNYSTVRAGYTAPYSLMAVILVAFSTLALLVALFAIQGTITSAILADVKVIGILRTQGFRPKDVRHVYELQYLVLALVALPPGVVAGVFVIRQSVGLLTRSIGTPIGAGPLFLLGAGTLVLFLGLVYGFVVRVARTAGSIRPAEAIRYGAVPRRATKAGGLSWRRLRTLPLPLLLAIKNLSLQKGRAFFLAASVVFATLAASLAVNLDVSFQSMRTDLAPFGFDGADVRVSRTGRRFGLRHEAMMQVLNTRDDVSAVATWDALDGTTWMADTGYPQTVTGNVVDGDMEGLRYTNLRGRNPEGPTEASLAVGTATDLQKDVGDTVAINVMGVTLQLEVSGVYQTINNTGHGFRVRLDAIQTVNPLWRPTQYGVVLTPDADPDGFISALENEYGEAVDAKPGDYFVRDQLAGILAGLRMANGFLAVVFLLAASVFIFNTTLLGIAENRRLFGILKTTGMTPRQLRAAVVWGVGVQAVLGLVAGVALWSLAAPIALSAFFSQVGLVAFPLQTSIGGMFAAATIILGFCLLSAWLPSKRVLRLNPRALIVE